MTVAYGNMNQSQRHRTSSGAPMSHGGEQMLLVSYVHCGDSESSMPAITELMVDCTVLTYKMEHVLCNKFIFSFYEIHV